MATTGESEGVNGYDYNLVEPPPERLLCRICHLPCRDTQSSEYHVYCKQCITDLKIKRSASVSDSCVASYRMLIHFTDNVGEP